MLHILIVVVALKQNWTNDKKIQKHDSICHYM